jgi:hypothetical protein
MGLDSALEDDVIRPSSKASFSTSARARLRAMLLRRRRAVASRWDIRLEEEQRMFGQSMRVFEPRQKGEIVMASIFEVLEEQRL